MLRALRHRDYRYFWIGQTLSMVGSWMQTVGQAWLVLELTDSPLKLGLIWTLQFLPALFLSLPAGALIDRYGKRRLLLVANGVMGATAVVLTFLVYSGMVQFWHICLMALACGLAGTVEIPARQSFQFDLVGKADLHTAVALNSASFNVARVLGPALAGMLIAHFGVGPTFALNSLSFGFVLLALCLMRTEGRATGAHPAFWEEMKEGVQYTMSTPQVLVPLRLLMVLSTFVINHNVMLPLLARDVLHTGPEGLGWLTAALGVGALSACVVAAQEERHRPSMLAVIFAAAIFSMLSFLIAPVRSMGVALFMLYCFGFAQVRFTVGTNTILQVVTPDHLRGRVLSIYSLVFAGTVPFGALWAGWVCQYWGVSAAYALGGLAGLTACLLWTPGWGILTRLIRRRAIASR